MRRVRSSPRALGVVVDELETRLHPLAPASDEVDETQPSIMLTSLMGSKGLQAEHVFIIGVNDGHFPRSNAHVTDEEVCQLLVALTRTRKSCTLVSTGRFGAASLKQSVFINWLQPLLARVKADKHYFTAQRERDRSVTQSLSCELPADRGGR